MHISRYIHLNHKNYRTWPRSSLKYYAGDAYARWLKPGRILELFDFDTKRYVEFVDDYSDRRNELALLKKELAG